MTASTVLDASATPYTIVATFTPTNATNFVSGGTTQQTLTVSKTGSTTTVSISNAVYTGSPVKAAGTVTGANLHTTPTSFNYVGDGA